MKKKLTKIGVAAAIAVTLILAGCPAPGTSGTDGTNGTGGTKDFDGRIFGETSNSALADPGYFQGDNGFAISESTDAKVGSKSLKVDWSGVPANAWNGVNFNMKEGTHDLSKHKVISFWAKSVTGTAEINEFGFGADPGGDPFKIVVKNQQLTADWAQYFVPFPNAAKLTAIKNVFFAVDEGQGATILIDEVKLDTTATVVKSVAAPADATRSVQKDGTSNIAVASAVLTVAGKDYTVTGAIQNHMTWASDKTDIATVDANGKITGVAAGTATITGTLGEKTVTVNVTVTGAAAPFTGVIFDDALKGDFIAKRNADGLGERDAQDSTANKSTGTKSKEFDLTGAGAWGGGFIKSTAGVDASSFNGLVFSIDLSALGTVDTMELKLEDTANNQTKDLVKDFTATKTDGNWKTYTISFSDFGSIDFAKFSAVGFWHPKGGTPPALKKGKFYVDDVKFVTLAPSQATAPPAAALGTPTAKSNSITLPWTAPTLGATHKQRNGENLTAGQVSYEVFYVAKGTTTTAIAAAALLGDTNVQSKEVVAGTTTATLTGLAADTNYHILLRTINSTDPSKYADSGVVVQKTSAAAPFNGVIFDDALQNDFIARREGGGLTGINAPDTATKKTEGQKSKEFDITGWNGWGGGFFKKEAGVDASGFTHLVFSIDFSALGTIDFMEFKVETKGGTKSQNLVGDYLPTKTAGDWKTYSVPLSDLSGTDTKQLTVVGFFNPKDGATPKKGKFYVDDVKFVKLEASQATAPPSAALGTTPDATKNTITVSWTAPTTFTANDHKKRDGNALEAAQLAYRVFYLANAATTALAADALLTDGAKKSSAFLPSGTTTTTLSGLTPDTNYHILLQTVNSTDSTKAANSAVIVKKTEPLPSLTDGVIFDDVLKGGFFAKRAADGVDDIDAPDDTTKKLGDTGNSKAFDIPSKYTHATEGEKDVTWGGGFFQNDAGVDVSAYSHLQFSVDKSAFAADVTYFQIKLEDTTRANGDLNLLGYTPTKTGDWETYTVPLANFPTVDKKKFKAFGLWNSRTGGNGNLGTFSPAKFYVDDVKFITPAAATMTLTSTAFANGGPISADFAGTNKDTNPPLAWTNLPPGSESSVVYMYDIDAPTFAHWLIYDIPKTVTTIAQKTTLTAINATAKSMPTTQFYVGPSSATTHTYKFTVFALRQATINTAGADATALATALRGFIEAGKPTGKFTYNGNDYDVLGSAGTFGFYKTGQ